MKFLEPGPSHGQAGALQRSNWLDRSLAEYGLMTGLTCPFGWAQLELRASTVFLASRGLARGRGQPALTPGPGVDVLGLDPSNLLRRVPCAPKPFPKWIPEFSRGKCV